MLASKVQLRHQNRKMMSKSLPPPPSRKDEGAGAALHEQSSVFSSSSSSSKAFIPREEPFNLNSYQLKKLQNIMLRVQQRKNHQKVYDPSLSKSEIRLMQMEELIISESENYRRDRVKYSKASDALRFAVMGDEFHLRQEIEIYGKKLLNLRDMFSGRTPLHEAAGSGHLHLVRMMCGEFKADPNVRTLLGNSTALHIAVEKGFRQIASMLITYGADVNAKDAHGRTPLHLVSTLGVTKLLFRYPVKANLKSNEGLLPSLHYWKYTAEDDRVAEIMGILSRNEDKAAAEDKREAILLAKLRYERSLGMMQDFPNAISQNTTIESVNKNHRVKNAYHYDVNQGKEIIEEKEDKYSLTKKKKK